MNKKKKADRLFEIIHSLTPSEKQLCVLDLQKFTSTKTNMFKLLFDALNKAKEYNELEILQQLEIADSKQLNNLKTKLYYRILDVIATHFNKLTSDIEIQDLLIKSEILYYKGLLNQAFELLNKAKKQSYLTTNFNHADRIINTQMIIISVKKEISKKGVLLEEELIKINKIKQRIGNINANTRKILLLYKDFNRDSKKQLKLLDQCFLTTKSIEKSFLEIPPSNYELVLISYYHYGNYYRAKGDLEKGAIYISKALTLLEEDQQLKLDNYHMYLYILGSRVSLLIKNNNTDLALEYLENLRKEKVKQKIANINTIKNQIFEFLLINELELLIKLERFKIARNTLLYFIKYFNKNRALMNDFTLPKFYFNIVYVYFKNKEYREVLFWTNKYINKKHSFFPEIENAILILNILSFLRLKKYNVAHNQLNLFANKLKKSGLKTTELLYCYIAYTEVPTSENLDALNKQLTYKIKTLHFLDLKEYVLSEMDQK